MEDSTNKKPSLEDAAKVSRGGSSATTVGSRRARLPSSLDYKAKGNSHLHTTTKPKRRKTPQQIQQEQEELQQQQLLQYRRDTSTRARGSSGPPPRKYDLSDLDNMNENELLQALYADPELAAADAKVSEEARGTSGAPTGAQKGTSRQARNSRRKARSQAEVSEYPDHLRDMMDGGVPVMQWVILLLLFGAALNQLRKILTSPDATKGSNVGSPTKASRSLAAAKGKQKKRKQGKVAMQDRQRKQTVIEETTRSIDKREFEKPTSASSSPVRKDKTPPRKQSSKKKKKVKAKKDKQPDAISTDGSAGPVHDEEPVKAAPPQLSSPIHTVTSAEEEDSGEWHTVTKSRNIAIQKETKETIDAKPTSEKEETPPSLASEVGAVASTEETKPTNGLTESSAQMAPVDPSPVSYKGKNKKKKRNKAKPNTISTDDASPTDDDAALAQMLQNEEMNLARDGTSMSQEEEWEEVPKRSRKAGKTSL